MAAHALDDLENPHASPRFQTCSAKEAGIRLRSEHVCGSSSGSVGADPRCRSLLGGRHCPTLDHYRFV
jgi:hypothetical protein